MPAPPASSAACTGRAVAGLELEVLTTLAVACATAPARTTGDEAVPTTRATTGLFPPDPLRCGELGPETTTRAAVMNAVPRAGAVANTRAGLFGERPSTRPVTRTDGSAVAAPTAPGPSRHTWSSCAGHAPTDARWDSAAGTEAELVQLCCRSGSQPSPIGVAAHDDPASDADPNGGSEPKRSVHDGCSAASAALLAELSRSTSVHTEIKPAEPWRIELQVEKDGGGGKAPSSAACCSVSALTDMQEACVSVRGSS
eukprot:6210327-Pleurochrysis_carterae.AAC.4